MKFLLDTHLLLWAAGDPARLSEEAKSIFNDPFNELYFSAASLWEVAIKQKLKREDFKVDPRLLRRGLSDHGYHELEINSQHTLATLNLPDFHQDPFDRILVAQATVEGIMLLTSDVKVSSYPGPVRLI